MISKRGGKQVRLGLAGIWFQPFWAFQQDEYTARAKRLGEVARGLGASFVAAPAAFQDAEGAVAAARMLNDKADLAILDVAAFPEGKAAGAFFDTLRPPLVLWARDETTHGRHIGHNSFCGANFLAGNLALRGRRFRALHGACTGGDFKSRLRTALRLVGAAKAAAGSRIGLLGGGIVPKFYDIDIQPADRTLLRQRWDIEFVELALDQLVKRAEGCPQREVGKALGELKGRFARLEVEAPALEKIARLLVAMRLEARERRFAALAVRCWPELQQDYGVWPCVAVSLLNELGIPTACEGDPAGALDMLLAARLAEGPSTLLDIVDWDDKAETFSIWHCGPTASSWATRGGASVAPHNVDGRTSEGKPAAGLPAIVDMDFRPGPVTVFRTLGAVDDEFVVQGRLVAPGSRRIHGSFGLLGQAAMYGRRVSVEHVRRQILDRALPHHYTAARGHLFK